MKEASYEKIMSDQPLTSKNKYGFMTIQLKLIKYCANENNRNNNINKTDK